MIVGEGEGGGGRALCEYKQLSEATIDERFNPRSPRAMSHISA
jgi:hypothetical protein